MKIKNIGKKLNEIFQKFIKEKCMYILKEQKIIIIFILLYCFVIFFLGSFLTKDNFFFSVLILIPFLSFYTYLIRVDYFKKELKNIDKMNRFLINAGKLFTNDSPHSTYNCQDFGDGLKCGYKK